jgi:hypothetical protein
MAIQPIKYQLEEYKSGPFFEGIKEGAEMQRILAARDLAQAQTIEAQQKAQQAALLQQRRESAFSRLNAPDANSQDFFNAAMLANEQEAKVIAARMKQNDEAQNRAAISRVSPTVFALHANKPERAIAELEMQMQAHEGDPETQQVFQRRIDAIKSDPRSAKLGLTAEMSLIPGAKEVIDNILKLTAEERAQEQAKVDIRKGTAEATSAEAKAEFARRQEIASLKQKAASAGLSVAQTNQSLAQTKNLEEQGRMLALDFKAALNGLPLPSKGKGESSEDERKAGGWFAQADNAYRNMLSAMYTKKGAQTGAENPGLLETIAPFGQGFVRSPERQRFVQASESLSEALLRAATGAGITKDEAAQKARELTPSYSDDESTKAQKLAAIPVYLQSLHSRAGREAPRNYQLPQPPIQTEQPQGMPQGKTGVTVTLPNGQSFVFPNQQAADQFKARAGVR